MESIIRKPSAGAMALALLMLFFGCLMFLFGYFAVSEWRSERAALIACGGVWILTGPAILGSALWLFGSLGRNRLALRIGGTAIVASGTVLGAAAAVGVMQCTGPGWLRGKLISGGSQILIGLLALIKARSGASRRQHSQSVWHWIDGWAISFRVLSAQTADHLDGIRRLERVQEGGIRWLRVAACLGKLLKDWWS
jgi:hypothetical protein